MIQGHFVKRWGYSDDPMSDKTPNEVFRALQKTRLMAIFVLTVPLAVLLLAFIIFR
jgi:hypothetical protein